MSMDNTKAATAKTKTPVATPPAAKVPDAIPAKTPPLFRRIDWMAFLITTLFVWAGYFWTLAPDLGLEDSGELAVASLYAGIPHPPGYPVYIALGRVALAAVEAAVPGARPATAASLALALLSAIGGALAAAALGVVFRALDKRAGGAPPASPQWWWATALAVAAATGIFRNAEPLPQKNAFVVIAV